MLLFELKASNARELTEDKINKKSADAYHSLRRALNKKIIKATKQGKFECEIMVPDAVVSFHRERDSLMNLKMMGIRYTTTQAHNT